MATLHVRFSGLFLFARHHRDGDPSQELEGVTALAVDARDPVSVKRATMKEWGELHLDRTEPVPHVGYVSVPLRYVPGAQATGPTVKHEMVMRLDRQQIAFEGLSSAPFTVERPSGETASPDEAQPSGVRTSLPNVADFERMGGLRVDPACVGPQPPDSVLARISLDRGRILAPREEWIGSWKVRGVDAEGTSLEEREEPLAGVLEWEVPFEGDSLTLTLTSFDDGTVSSFPLQAVEGRIWVDLGNLCATNPLQWFPELSRPQTGRPAEDFKWFYFLLDDRRALARALRDSAGTLPVPAPAGGGAGIWIECMIATALVIATVAAFAKPSP